MTECILCFIKLITTYEYLSDEKLLYRSADYEVRRTTNALVVSQISMDTESKRLFFGRMSRLWDSCFSPIDGAHIDFVQQPDITDGLNDDSLTKRIKTDKQRLDSQTTRSSWHTAQILKTNLQIVNRKTQNVNTELSLKCKSSKTITTIPILNNLLFNCQIKNLKTNLRVLI